jgi:hypothetical protein
LEEGGRGWGAVERRPTVGCGGGVGFLGHEGGSRRCVWGDVLRCNVLTIQVRFGGDGGGGPGGTGVEAAEENGEKRMQARARRDSVRNTHYGGGTEESFVFWSQS